MILVRIMFMRLRLWVARQLLALGDWITTSVEKSG
jgi:hypothetical protein